MHEIGAVAHEVDDQLSTEAYSDLSNHWIAASAVRCILRPNENEFYQSINMTLNQQLTGLHSYIN